MKKALYTILISLGLAFIFNYLFFGKLIGISVLVFNIVVLGAVYLFAQKQKIDFQKSAWLGLAILFFALMISVRASEVLNFLNVCAIIGLLMLLARELTGTPVFLMKIWDYFILITIVPLKMLARALSTISLVTRTDGSNKRDLWVRVAKGVIMAIPVLVIFGILFSQADLAFSSFLNSFLNITISERAIRYLVLLSIVFVAALSFLSYIFFPKQEPGLASEQSHATEPGRNIEAMISLGLIATLFLVFIGFQVTYLFGGESNIINTGFTYAEYARRGFFELFAVAVLSLLVLLATEKYAGSQSRKDKKFLIPATILIAEVIVVMISAFKRLSLYIDAYSMTEQRFYVAAFIFLLFVLFILLAIKFIKAKPEQFFTFGALVSIIAFLITINLVNPEAFIAKSNIERYNRTGKIDVFHVGKLSADAVPAKIGLYHKLQGQEKEDLKDLLLKQKDKLKESSENWQSKNLSRAKAWSLLQELNNLY